MPKRVKSILAIDDDEHILGGYRRAAGRDRTVFATTEVAEAIAAAQRERFDLAIVDLRIKNDSGIALTRELKRLQPSVIVALCSGYLSVDIAVAAVRAGVDLVKFKPVTVREILRQIENDEPPTPEPDLEETPTLARAEWEHITRVLADCNGNRSLAARRLGIYRSSLQRRLRKFAPRA
jgi:two-component system response regulator RegA